MLVCLIVALAVAAEPQSNAPDRARAEHLAQTGHAEAIKLFEQVAEENPRDIEARHWLARLALRMGRPSQAETDRNGSAGGADCSRCCAGSAA